MEARSAAEEQSAHHSEARLIGATTSTRFKAFQTQACVLRSINCTATIAFTAAVARPALISLDELTESLAKHTIAFATCQQFRILLWVCELVACFAQTPHARLRRLRCGMFATAPAVEKLLRTFLKGFDNLRATRRLLFGQLLNCPNVVD